jgi:transcriptional regulator with XRE-family HTH domain
MKSEQDILQEIGIQIKRLRLRKNIDQNELARKSNVSLNTIKRLESGNGATLTSLIKVLVILEQKNWFNILAPVVSISPMQMLKLGHERQRASKKQHREIVK